MRANWTPDLAKLVQRTDPAVRDTIEAVAVTAKDQRVLASDWQGVDSLTGLETDGRGGLTLSGAQATLLEQASSDGYATDLNAVSPFYMAKVVLNGAEVPYMDIRRVTVYLDPDEAGTGQEVVTWACQLFILNKIDTAYGRSLIPIGDELTADAGASAGDVLFDFGAHPVLPNPKAYNPQSDAPPTLYVRIRGYDADGAAVGSVGWARDSGTSSVTTSGNVLTAVILTDQTSPWGTGWYTEASDTLGCPRIKIETGDYASATAAFTTTPLDLGETPSDAANVRFRIQARTPPGTSVQGYAKVASGDSWVAFADGDSAEDLGLAAHDTYCIEAVLTPSGDSTARPSIVELAVEDVTIIDLSDVAWIAAVNYAADPFDLHGEITQATLQALHDGLPDYRDAITLLMAEHNIMDLEFRWRIGGMLRDIFMLDENADPGPAMELTLISRIGWLNGVTPIPTGSSPNITRTPKVYTNQTLKDASDDLLDSEGALPASDRGPGISDDTTEVSKTIIDSRVKAELDDLAFIAGGTFATSQGRVKFFDAYGDKPISAIFPMEEIVQGRVSPGWSRRVPECYMKFGYNPATQDWDGESKAENATALANVGVARIMPPKWIDEEVGRWVSDSALADALTVRQAKAFGFGEITIPFQAIYRQPQLELHDLVAVQTDRFAARDPLSGRALRGRLWALCDLVGIHDAAHTQFTGWVRSFSDIIASSYAIARNPAAVYCAAYMSGDFTCSTGSHNVTWDSDLSDGWGMHDTSTDTHLFTVPAGGAGRWVVDVRLIVKTIAVGQLSVTLNQTGVGSPIAQARVDYGDPVPATVSLHIIADAAEGDTFYLASSATSNCTLRGGGSDDTVFTIARLTPGTVPATGGRRTGGGLVVVR